MSTLRLFFIILIILNALAIAAIRGGLGLSQPAGEPEQLENQINPDLLVLGTTSTAPTSTAPNSPRQPAPSAPPPVAPVEEPTAPPSPVQIIASTAPPLSLPNAPATPPPEPPAEPQAPPAVVQAPPPAQPAEPPPSPVAPDPKQYICLAYDKLSEQLADRLEQAATAADPDAAILREPGNTSANWWVHLPSLGSASAAEARAKELREQGVDDLFIIREAGPSQFAISLGIFKTRDSANKHLANLVAEKRITGATIAPRTPPIFKMEIRGVASRLLPLANRPAAGLPASTGRCSV